MLLKNQSSVPKRDDCVSPEILSESQDDPDTDLDMFKKAMADVKKISRGNCLEKIPTKKTPSRFQNTTEAEILMRLENLVKHGTGFVVADTPEYMEGSGRDVNPEITKRLHRGDFSVQGHIDLHGLNVGDAHQAFEAFLRQSIAMGKRVVLIIHGRGLSSPAEPILKTKVYEWLTSGPWRKWVMAFSSARWCDGGAGATYVLLRQRPFSKRFSKIWKTNE
ncbi:MAG: Smr/MutS family protein [Desulfobacterales bacterium]|nr:MAG: Smr/MutS family protein [Desulfobacterales bacterium]